MNLSTKIIKNFLESVKQCTKNIHYSNVVTKYKNNIKKTWEVIKNSIGKVKCTKQILPQKIITKNKVVTDRGYCNSF